MSLQVLYMKNDVKMVSRTIQSLDMASQILKVPLRLYCATTQPWESCSCDLNGN